MGFIRKNWIVIVLTVAGLTGGYLYWRLVGCNTGSCPITSNWHSSVAFGGLFGFLLSDIVKDTVSSKNKGKEENK